MKQRALPPLNPALAIASAMAMAACPGRQPPRPADSPAPPTCDEEADCSAGAFCGEERTCVLGDCDPALEELCDLANLDSPFCCAADERCNAEALACEFDESTLPQPERCVVRIASVNGVNVAPADALTEVAPLDDVVLTVDDLGSGAPLVAWRWEIRETPLGSSVALTVLDEQQTSFAFDNGEDLGIDLVGEYCVRATITDTDGAGGRCGMCFEARAAGELFVQVSWDVDRSDVDLHMTKQDAQGRYCIANGNSEVVGGIAEECGNGLDCNYETCGRTDDSRPDWDGIAGESAGDPLHGADDVNGFGPETISVDRMSAGTYLVGVDVRSAPASEGAVGSTVRLFIHGRIAGELFVDQVSREWNDLALVRWPDGVTTTQPCVEDLTDGNFTDELDACDAVEAAEQP